MKFLGVVITVKSQLRVQFEEQKRGVLHALRRGASRTAAAVILGLGVGMFGLSGSGVTSAAAQTMMKVVSEDVTLHWGRDAGSEIFALLEVGATVGVIKFSGGWAVVRTMLDGQFVEGWVATRGLENYGVGPDGLTPLFSAPFVFTAPAVKAPAFKIPALPAPAPVADVPAASSASVDAARVEPTSVQPAPALPFVALQRAWSDPLSAEAIRFDCDEGYSDEGITRCEVTIEVRVDLPRIMRPYAARSVEIACESRVSFRTREGYGGRESDESASVSVSLRGGRGYETANMRHTVYGSSDDPVVSADLVSSRCSVD